MIYRRRAMLNIFDAFPGPRFSLGAASSAITYRRLRCYRPIAFPPFGRYDGAMTPVADSANPPAQMDAAAAEELLDGGEVILLATRPSGWFVLLTSCPVLVVAGLVSGATPVANSMR